MNSLQVSCLVPAVSVPQVSQSQSRASATVSSRLWRQRKLQRTRVQVHAQAGDDSRTSGRDAEVEALEAKLGLARRKSAKAESNGTGAPRKQFPKWEDPPSSPATGSRLPSKDEPDLSATALWQKWLQKDGGLATLNDLAYKSIYVLGGAWVVFRFVGPLVGAYELENPLVPPV